VLVGPDGAFASRLVLRQGQTEVRVTARDRLGRETTEVVQVTAPVGLAPAAAPAAAPDGEETAPAPMARKRYRKAPRSDISDDPSYVHMLRYCELGDWKEVEERCTTLLEEKGYAGTRFESTIWLTLAKAREQHGQLDRARELYRRCYESCDDRKGAWHAAKAKLLELGGELP
jgi:hypothetical protein